MNNSDSRWLNYIQNLNISTKINLNYISVFSDMYWTGSYNRQLQDSIYNNGKGSNVLITLQQLGLIQSIDGFKYVPTALGRQYITDLFRNRYVPKNINKHVTLWYIIFSFFGINQCDGHNYTPLMTITILFCIILLMDVNVLEALLIACIIGALTLLLNLESSITRSNISGIKPFDIFKCSYAEFHNHKCTLGYFINFLNRNHIDLYNQGMIRPTLDVTLQYGMFKHQSLIHNIRDNILKFRNTCIGMVSTIIREFKW